MTYPEYTITNYMWAIEILAKFYLLGLIAAKRYWKEVPVFTAYTFISLIWELSLAYIVAHGYYGSMHFWTYWYGQLVVTIVLFGVIAEILKSAFKTACSVFGTQIKFLLRVSVLVLCVLAYFGFQIQSEPTLDEFVRRLDRASSLLLLATFGFTALISNYLGLVWKPRVYGVALGFLFYYGVSAFVTVLMAGFHFAVPALNAISVFTFLLTEIIWISFFVFRPQRQTISKAEIEQLMQALAA